MKNYGEDLRHYLQILIGIPRNAAYIHIPIIQFFGENEFYIFHIYFTMKFFHYVLIYTCNYCLVLRTIPHLILRVIIINGIYGSP